jgi:hypothetical protein
VPSRAPVLFERKKMASSSSPNDDEDVPPNSCPSLMREGTTSTQESNDEYVYEEDDNDDDDDDNSANSEDEIVGGGSVENKFTEEVSKPTSRILDGSQRLKKDVDELNSFHSSSLSENCGITCWSVVRQGFQPILVVWLVLSPKRFLLDEERAFAWNLESDLAVKIEFGPDYLDDEQYLPKVRK